MISNKDGRRNLAEVRMKEFKQRRKERKNG